jgi:hypothetical protein
MPYGQKRFVKKKPTTGADETAVPVVRQWPKTIEGIKFDSPLEYYTWRTLMDQNINFEFKRKYELIKTFTYGGETVMGISLTVDFYLTDYDIILDPKGWQHGDNHLKWKLLMRWLYQKGLDPRIVFVYNKKAVQDFVVMLRIGFSETVDEKKFNGRVTKLKKLTKLVGNQFITKAGHVATNLSAVKIMASYDFHRLLTSLSIK